MITATDGLTPSQSVSCPRWSPPKKPRELADRTNGVGGAAATRLCMSVRSTNELLQPRRARARSLARSSIHLGRASASGNAAAAPLIPLPIPSLSLLSHGAAIHACLPSCLPAFLPSCQLLGVGWPMVEVGCCHVRPVIPVPQPAPLRTPSRLCQAYNLEDTRYIYKDGRERERESAS